MSDCFVLYLLLTCMKKKTSGADKFTNNNYYCLVLSIESNRYAFFEIGCRIPSYTRDD